MSEKIDLFILLKQNLPIFLLGGVILFIGIRNFLYKQIDNKDHDIDTLINKKKLTMQLGSNYSDSDTTRQLKQYLQDIDDPEIQNLLKALQWGDTFSYPLLAIPFGLDQQRCHFQFAKVLTSRYDGELKNYTELLEYIQKQINNFYIENPLKDFSDDDLLTIFSLLGVEQNSEDDIIKKRFHLLSQSFHPDKFKVDASEKIQANINHNYITIQKAYEILQKRKDI